MFENGMEDMGVGQGEIKLNSWTDSSSGINLGRIKQELQDSKRQDFVNPATIVICGGITHVHQI